MQKLIKTVSLITALALLGGCSYVGVYKRDLSQGNLVTQEMVAQLQPGMSRQQVVNVMGRPLLEAPFDASQWDYVFRLDEAYGEVQQRRLTLTFADDGRLADIQRQGDFGTDMRLRAQDGVAPAAEGTATVDDMPGPATRTLPESGGAPASSD